MTELLLQPLADAFLQVGVFVALMVGAFGYLQYRTGDRLTRFLASRWRTAPLVGALLGVTPGCGGAIIVMPLYLRGTVSFGTVVAALVATMGDSSFVIFAVAPGRALQIHAILLVAGICSGYLTDALGIDPRRRWAGDVVAQGRPGVGSHIASVGAAEAFAPAPAHVAATPLELVPRALWALVATGFVVAMPVLTGFTDGAALARYAAGVDPYLLVGVLGSVAAVVVYVRGGLACNDDTLDAIRARHHCVTDVLRHGARETAFVTVWVGAAYLVTTWVVVLGGIELAVVAGVTGLAGVLVGAAIGLIPGCAVQVILTGLYVTGAVPLATLLANAAAQDGDALFPLIMMDRRAAVVASVLTTVPALVVGTAVLMFG